MTSLAHPIDPPGIAHPVNRRQAAIGTTLATMIFGSWAAVHFVGVFVLTITSASLPLMVFLALFQTWLSVGLFIVAHDAMHGSLIPGRANLNARIGATLLFVYAGFSWARMRDAHFAHHRHAGSEQDPDFDADHPTRPMMWYWTFLKRYFGLGSIVYVMVVFYAYWLAFGAPLENILLFYAAPAILSSIQLFYFGTYRPHSHTGAAFADRHNARSERFGPLVSLLTCFHFGYHHEHHVSPGTPWWALPRRHRAASEAGAAR